MDKLQFKFEAWLDDVNREDGSTIQIMDKFLETMFYLIKWAGIPFVFYLLFEITKW